MEVILEAILIIFLIVASFVGVLLLLYKVDKVLREVDEEEEYPLEFHTV